MYLGKIMEIADKDALYERRAPQHPYTKGAAVRRARSRIPERGAGRGFPTRGEPPNPRNPPSGVAGFRGANCPLAQPLCAEAANRNCGRPCRPRSGIGSPVTSHSHRHRAGHFEIQIFQSGSKFVDKPERFSREPVACGFFWSEDNKELSEWLGRFASVIGTTRVDKVLLDGLKADGRNPDLRFTTSSSSNLDLPQPQRSRPASSDCARAAAIARRS